MVNKLTLFLIFCYGCNSWIRSKITKSVKIKLTRIEMIPQHLSMSVYMSFLKLDLTNSNRIQYYTTKVISIAFLLIFFYRFYIHSCSNYLTFQIHNYQLVGQDQIKSKPYFKIYKFSECLHINTFIIISLSSCREDFQKRFINTMNITILNLNIYYGLIIPPGIMI